MNITDRIRELCKNNGISVTKLEEILHFGNGSLTKSTTKAIGSDRVLAIADYFNVSAEYLLTGHTPEKSYNRDITDFEYEIVRKFRVISDESKRILLDSLNSAYNIAMEKKDENTLSLSKVG